VVGPFPASAVIARLETLPLIKFVSGATDLQSAIDAQPAVTPAVYVVVQEQFAEPKGFSGGTMVQDATVAIQLVIFVGNYAAKGNAAQKYMDEEVRPAIRAALLAWSPSSSFDRLSLRASRNEKFKPPNLMSQEIFRSGYRVQVQGIPP
jgi:hypothetical protein